MPHDAPVIYRHRRDPAAEIHQSYTVLHLGLGEHCLGFHVRGEIFPGYGYPELVECHVHCVQCGLLTDEYLEVPFEHAARHPDYVALHELEILSCGEGLGHSPEQLLTVGIVERIGVESLGLKVVHVFLRDAFLRVELHPRLSDLLPDPVFRHPDHSLGDLYVQLFLGILYQVADGSGDFHRVEHIAVPDARRRGFLVVDDLYVVFIYLGDCQSYLARPQVYGNNVSVFHYIMSFFICIQSGLRTSRPPPCRSSRLLPARLWNSSSPSARTSPPCAPVSRIRISRRLPSG